MNNLIEMGLVTLFVFGLVCWLGSLPDFVETFKAVLKIENRLKKIFQLSFVLLLLFAHIFIMIGLAQFGHYIWLNF